MKKEVFLRQKILTLMTNKIVLFIISVLLLASCKVVEPSDKINLNEKDMALKERRSQKFSSKFHNYREGSSGAKGGKSGGGCGCN